MEGLFYPDPLIRLPFYIAFGLLSEVLFTGIVDLIAPRFLSSWKAKVGLDYQPPATERDQRAMGYTFLWMIPIYALLIFIEPASRLFIQWEWPLWCRGFVYLLAFWVAEYATGWGIKKLTGRCPWDYTYSRFSLYGYIRLDFAPIWYLFALLLDGWFKPALILLTPCLKNIF